jgi:hypothetical protein
MPGAVTVKITRFDLASNGRPPRNKRGWREALMATALRHKRGSAPIGSGQSQATKLASPTDAPMTIPAQSPWAFLCFGYRMKA